MCGKVSVDLLLCLVKFDPVMMAMRCALVFVEGSKTLSKAFLVRLPVLTVEVIVSLFHCA